MFNTVTFEGVQITPSKIVCIGRNYVDHIKELGNDTPVEPVVFIKPNSSISTDIYTNDLDDIHYEGEISFLIRSGKIVGVGFGLDLTKRQIQSNLKENRLPWERAKAFDRSAVFSDFIAFEKNISSLRMELHINGVVKQASGCRFMINSPSVLLREISEFMTLEDNDIVMSGTPSGVGEVQAGDEFIGKLFSDDMLLLEQAWQVKT